MAFGAASLPWLFVSLYFVVVLLPANASGSGAGLERRSSRRPLRSPTSAVTSTRDGPREGRVEDTTITTHLAAVGAHGVGPLRALLH